MFPNLGSVAGARARVKLVALHARTQRAHIIMRKLFRISKLTHETHNRIYGNGYCILMLFIFVVRSPRSSEETHWIFARTVQ